MECEQRSRSATDVPETFDAIVIGSGIGGLTCASLLAQLRGQRVLVLERHFRLGGFTHGYSRPGGYRWDIGLHYVGQLEGGTPFRSLMEVVTRRSLRWNRLPDPFEVYRFPGLTISQPAEAELWRQVLVEQWPEERRGIGRYFDAVDSTFYWFAARMGIGAGMAGSAAPSRPSDRVALATTSDILNDCGLRDPALRAVLTAQWGNYGVPPGHSAFVTHAVVVKHFMCGGWYPQGGAAGIAGAAAASIEAAGGRCLVRNDVEEVIIERGRAVGVRVLSGPQRARQLREFRAPVVISDAGAGTTFSKLLRGDAAEAVAGARAHTARLASPVSAVQLFLGLRRSPAELGLRGENHWLFRGFDHDELHSRRDGLLDGEMSSAFLSFPSLNDPSQLRHTIHVVAPISRNAFAPWSERPWMRRGREYAELKERITLGLIASADRELPGLAALVDYSELATPLTFEHFSGHQGGGLYGVPGVPERYATGRLGVATPVPGLLLTGSDVSVSGIAGAMMGGAMTAGHIFGTAGYERVFAAVGELARQH